MRGVTADRGSTLLLFPVGILIVMVLSAIAVDLSMVHSGQRDLARVVHAAANDAASDLDVAELRRSGEITIDLVAARRTVSDRLRTASIAVDDIRSVRVEAGPRPRSLRVRVDASVRHLFGRAVPGVADAELVHVDVVAELGIAP